MLLLMSVMHNRLHQIDVDVYTANLLQRLMYK
jgi:hypothetical protein